MAKSRIEILKSFPNGSNVTEDHIGILEAIGKENTEKIFEIVGGKKITLKPLIDYLKRVEIKKAINTTNLPLTTIAKKYKISVKTVRKIMKLKIPI
jgi:Mor family transcriptional regulator